MYFSKQDHITTGPRLARPVRTGIGRVGIGANVLLLGLTSLLTDVSTEMVRAIVPIYLTTALGFTVLQYGFFDGIEQGITAFVRVASGLVADRRRRYKEVAAAGYGVSALCKLGLLALGTVWAVFFLLLDRVGKGIRTAPRDALISLSAPKSRLGEAFGVHRAMDTVGAVAGPMLASGLLLLTPGRFDIIFLTSFCIALVGLGVIVLFVENRSAHAEAAPGSPPITWRDAWTLLGLLRFRWVVAAGVTLGLASVSDQLFYLVLLKRLASLELWMFPLFSLGTALPYLLLAMPAGRLADRIGRRSVFLAGHSCLAVVYGLLLLPTAETWLVITCFILHGSFYAATDGVLPALASTQLPERQRTTGLALLTTFTTLARLFGSIAFGLLWDSVGIAWALGIFLCALAVGVLVAAPLLPRRNEGVAT